MGEQVYELWEVPLNRPSNILSAVRSVDQQLLLDFVKQSGKPQRPYPDNNLIPFIELGVELGALKTVKARVPHNNKQLDLVDLDSFQDDFNRFVTELQRGQYGLDSAEIHQLLVKAKQPKLTGVEAYKALLKRYIRSSLGPVVSNKVTLRLAEKACFSSLRCFVELTRIGKFPAFQITPEICGLLSLLAQNQPKTVLEIGTCRGGTLYLFTKVAAPTATLVSVDLNVPNQDLLGSFARNQQKIVLFEGNSTDPEIIASVKEALPNEVDFLFIDGDHSYTGLAKDFKNYAPLVKPGGLIAFHDIVEDNETRYGIVTGGWAGGVPRFWDEIKKDYEHTEFINDPQQDGSGIGVLYTPTSRPDGS